MAPIRTIEWVGGRDGFLRLLDQTRLPTEVVYRDCRQVEDVCEAIRALRVRGAPAIGVAAAFGLVLHMQKDKSDGDRNHFELGLTALGKTRPTAINLHWALRRMEGRFNAAAAAPGTDVLGALLQEAQTIAEEDRQMCTAMGRHGAALIEDGQGVLTHCNTGALATAGSGTALAVLAAAAQQGKRFRVYADETRPLLQGARLTAWELQQLGIPVTLLCDSMAAQVMKEGRVRRVIVGADRIAANGDTANKIGTYGVALLARAHGIPFYVAAPSSTFDLSVPTGESIPIEQRDPREITHGFGKPTAPDGIEVYNPAFDVTPHHLIAAIITERGIIQPVNIETVRQHLASSL